MKQLAHYLADAYAWFRWARLPPWCVSWAAYRRSTQLCRACSAAVYKGWLGKWGNP